MNHYEVNYLLFNTNSIFHNAGLSIYALNGEYFDRHSITFLSSDFEKIKLPAIEDTLKGATEELQTKFNAYIKDATDTVRNLTYSVGRQGVLISHINLKDQMRPHIHRQGYATEILPCITVHYRIGNQSKSQFRFWDPVTQEDAIKYDLCRRDAILEWCDTRADYKFDLPKKKNIILFNSGLLPHSIVHTEDLNLYFVFDHVRLKTPELYKGLPVLINE